MLYGVTGTLNMADIAQKLPQVPAGDRGLLHAGAAILGVAFLAKAAIWPLNFWLVAGLRGGERAGGGAVRDHDQGRHLRRAAPVDAVLPVGRRRRRRRSAPTRFVYGGLATLAFGAFGMLASQRLAASPASPSSSRRERCSRRSASATPALSGGALFYLLGSTLAASALFLLVELIERCRVEVDRRPLADDAAEHAAVRPGAADRSPPADDVNLDDDEQPLIGRAIPAAIGLPRPGLRRCARC